MAWKVVNRLPTEITHPLPPDLVTPGLPEDGKLADHDKESLQHELVRLSLHQGKTTRAPFRPTTWEEKKNKIQIAEPKMGSSYEAILHDYKSNKSTIRTIDPRSEEWIYSGVSSEYLPFRDAMYKRHDTKRDNDIIKEENRLSLDILQQVYLPRDPEDPTYCTPLFVFPSKFTEEECHTNFFMKNEEFVVLDAKMMKQMKSVRKQSVISILSEARPYLAQAMKHGKILVIRLQDSMVDFLKTFNDDCCPLDSISSSNIRQKGYKDAAADLYAMKNIGRSQFPIEALLLSGWLLRHDRSTFPARVYRSEDLRDLSRHVYGMSTHAPLTKKLMLAEYLGKPQSNHMVDVVVEAIGDREVGRGDIVEPDGNTLSEEMDDEDEESLAASGSVSVDEFADMGKHRPVRPKNKNILARCHPGFRVMLTTSVPIGTLDEAYFSGKYGLPDRSHFEIVFLEGHS